MAFPSIGFTASGGFAQSATGPVTAGGGFGDFNFGGGSSDNLSQIVLVVAVAAVAIAFIKKGK